MSNWTTGNSNVKILIELKLKNTNLVRTLFFFGKQPHFITSIWSRFIENNTTTQLLDFFSDSNAILFAFCTPISSRFTSKIDPKMSEFQASSNWNVTRFRCVSELFCVLAFPSLSVQKSKLRYLVLVMKLASRGMLYVTSFFALHPSIDPSRPGT